jgi:hypothetical protein
VGFVGNVGETLIRINYISKKENAKYITKTGRRKENAK